MSESAVQFEGSMRVHVALPVKNLDASRAFYEALLQQTPTKLREGYAKFEVASPPVNLTLNESTTPPSHHSVSHFGIQVKNTAEVAAAHSRMRTAGFTTMSEEGVTCCFAVQDKVWIVDPDGHRWEVFVVLDADAPVHSLPLKTEENPEGDAPRCCS